MNIGQVVKKVIITLAAMTVLFVPAAHAEFTPAEKGQVAKIATAHAKVWGAIHSLAHGMSSHLVESTRAQYVEVLDKLLSAAGKCSGAHQYILGIVDAGDREEWFTDAPGNGRTNDLNYVAARVPQCSAKLQEATALIIAYGFDQYSSVTSVIDDAVFALNTFDKDETGAVLNLGYASPLTPSFPRVIDVHGDVDIANNSLTGGLQYLQNGSYAAKNFLSAMEVYTPAASVTFEHVWRDVGTAGSMMARTLAASNEAPIPEDQEAIDRASAASFGRRPPEFFFLVRAIELANGDGRTRNFAGDKAPTGASIAMGFLTLRAAYLLQPLILVNSKAEVEHWTIGGKGGRNSNRDGRGRYLAMVGDFQDSAWRFARWVDQSAGFKLDPPNSPPTSGPPPELVCGTGTTQDNATTPASCVAEVVVCPPDVDEVLRVDSVVSNDVNGTIQFSCRP